MPTRRLSRTIGIDTQHTIYSVVFAEDGKHVLSGGKEGMLRRWRVDDGNEVGDPIRVQGAEIYAVALSPDRKWLVCGLRFSHPKKGGAHVRVWDAKTHEKVLDITGHTNSVYSVDVSPDSTKFATGSADKHAFIWNITTGDKLVGPLEHDGTIVAVRFSPKGDRIATATADKSDENSEKSIRIYDSENGYLLFEIPFAFKTCMSSWLAWSADGRQLFASSRYKQVKRFDTSLGSLLSTWSVPGGWPASVILSRNQKFAVVVAGKSLSLWDASAQQQIGTAIEHASFVWSIALSPNDDWVATGEDNGKVTLWSLRDILPPSYLTVNVSDQLGNVHKSDTSTSPFFYHREFSNIHSSFSLTIFFSITASQLPFMYISDAMFKSWIQGDLTRVEQLLTEEIIRPSSPFHHARTLAYRALVRARSRQWDTATQDAEKVFSVHPVIPCRADCCTPVNHGSTIRRWSYCTRCRPPQ